MGTDASELLRWVRMGACAELEQQMEGRLRAVQPEARESVRNLIHYLALRREDLRQVQPALAELGLSSLGRSESHVTATHVRERRKPRTSAGLDDERVSRRKSLCRQSDA